MIKLEIPALYLEVSQSGNLIGYENVQIDCFVNFHLDAIIQLGILQCFQLVAFGGFLFLFYKLTSLSQNKNQTFFYKGES